MHFDVNFMLQIPEYLKFNLSISDLIFIKFSSLTWQTDERRENTQ